MPCENCSNTEPEGVDNPFTHHANCDHADMVVIIEPIPGKHVDLWRFLIAIDKDLGDGDIRSARSVVWALGIFFEMIAANPDYASQIFDTALGLQDLENVDDELKRLVEKERGK